MHFVFGALAHASLFERYGVPAMRRWSINPETGTASEMWGTGDFSHGWTGSPLIQMSSRMLGVTPTAAGFMTVAIRPLPSGLEWAHGTVPTPHGRVEVSWRQTGSDMSVRVSLPDGVTGEAFLVGVLGIRVNGRSVSVGRGGKLMLPAGSHEITGRRPKLV